MEKDIVERVTNTEYSRIYDRGRKVERKRITLILEKMIRRINQS